MINEEKYEILKFVSVLCHLLLIEKIGHKCGKAYKSANKLFLSLTCYGEREDLYFPIFYKPTYKP